MGEEQQGGTTIMEEREELMVPPHGGNPSLRQAHFLKPSVSTIKAPVFELPPPSFPPSSSNVLDLPLNVSFSGFRDPHKNWKTWFDRMLPLHQSTWKKAGIYQAITNSTYQIQKDKEIVMGLAEKWCFDTNSFVFGWGEGTISLEDVGVLGGYSVLGNSVLTRLETKGLIEINEKLLKARSKLRRGRGKKPDQGEWLRLFMGRGSEIEHEAFLVFWLSRHVFPSCPDMVSKDVHDIAIHLARGTRIALAPAVLSCLYRDLRLLKKAIVTSAERTSKVKLNILAPMQLVQIWAWERFPTLRPLPNPLGHGEPRMARWNKKNKVKNLGIENVGWVLDSARECFQWRPYAVSETNWNFPKFYNEGVEWVLVCPSMDEDLESFARFLRPCELVGLDSIECYLPHRVAMQFGMDQDLPGRVTRFNANPEIAWNNYTRPIKDANLYVPSRLFESGVTTRYVEWWEESKLAQTEGVKGDKGGKRITESPRKSPEISKRKKVGNDSSASPSKRKRVEAAKSDGEDERRLVVRGGNKMPGDGKSFPCTQPQSPGSLTAYNGAGERMESQVEPAEITMWGKAAISVKKHILVESAGNKMPGDGKIFPCTQPQTPSNLSAGNGAGESLEFQVESGENSLWGEAANSVEKDEHILVESAGNQMPGAVESFPCTQPHQTPSSLTADNGSGNKMESEVVPGENSMRGEAAMGGSKHEKAIESTAGIESNGMSFPCTQPHQTPSSITADNSAGKKKESQVEPGENNMWVEAVMGGSQHENAVENNAVIESNGMSFPCTQPYQTASSLTADNGAGNKKESEVGPGENSMQGEAAMGGSHRPSENDIEGIVGIPSDNGASIDNNEADMSTQSTTEIPELEARISRLDIVVARLKAQRLGLRSA